MENEESISGADCEGPRLVKQMSVWVSAIKQFIILVKQQLFTLAFQLLESSMLTLGPTKA